MLYSYTLPLIEYVLGQQWLRTFLVFDPLILDENTDDLKYKSRTQWFEANCKSLQFNNLQGTLECYTPSEGHGGCSISYIVDKSYEHSPKTVAEYQRYDDQLAKQGLTNSIIYKNLAIFQPTVNVFNTGKMGINIYNRDKPYNRLVDQWQDLLYKIIINYPLLKTPVNDNIVFVKGLPLLWYFLVCEALDSHFIADTVNKRSFNEMLECEELDSQIKIYLNNLINSMQLVYSLESLSLQCYSFTK